MRDPRFFPAPKPWKPQLSPDPLLAERRIRVGLLRLRPVAAGQEADAFPGSRLGWHDPGLQGKPRPSPGLPSAPGREAEDEWPWPQGGGGAGSPGPAGCAGLRGAVEARLAEARAL